MRAGHHLLTELPAPRSSLVGRDDELGELLHEARARRVVTVVGPGGIGKTRLAVALAHELAERGQRIGFVELADVTAPWIVVDAIADQLGVEVVPGASRYDGLVRWLAAAPTVLVVDNLEHVIDAAPDLVALLDECAGLHLVVTSRRALRVADEHVVSVGPLAATAPEGADAAPGVQLLLDRSHADHPHPADVETASRIVSGVGGLPLAIELAAFRARSLGLATVHELLVADLALDGFRGPAGEPERHSSLRQCLEWTYRDLDDRARAVFHATGHFAGTFDLPALRAVVGDERIAAVGLATLVEHHLVDRIAGDDGTARFTSSPPIREFAREVLAARPEHDAIVDAHARWYGSVAKHIRHTFETTSANDAFAEFRREQANINAAIGARQRAHEYGEAATIGCDVAKLATEVGREGRVNEWFRHLVRLAQEDGIELPFEPQVWAAYGELMTHSPGTAAAALAALEGVIVQARAAGDDVAVLRGLDRLSISVVAHGDVARAIAASGEGLELAARLGLSWPRAQLAIWHAMLLHVTGDIPAACAFGLDGLRIARRLGDGRLIVRVGLLFAPMPRTPEMEAERVPTLPQCLELARDHGSVIDEMYVMMQLAIQAGFHRGEDVFALAADGLELADRTRSHPAELIFMLALAGAAFDAGDDDVAMVLDGALRPEWAALATVMPAAALEHYDRIVARRRSVDPDRFDGSTTATVWPDALAAARRYAAAGGEHARCGRHSRPGTHGPRT